MALRDPVAVYNAANNMEAHTVRSLLVDAGIEAFVTEDVSTVGVWMFGLISEIHKPQVWIDRSNIEQAVPHINEYECRLKERADMDDENESVAAPGKKSEVFCYHCGEAIDSDESTCPECGKTLDWSDKPTGEEVE